MSSPRISIQNFLQASEIVIQDHGAFTLEERALLQFMLSRLSLKLYQTKDPDDPVT